MTGFNALLQSWKCQCSDPFITGNLLAICEPIIGCISRYLLPIALANLRVNETYTASSSYFIRNSLFQFAGVFDFLFCFCFVCRKPRWIAGESRGRRSHFTAEQTQSLRRVSRSHVSVFDISIHLFSFLFLFCLFCYLNFSCCLSNVSTVVRFDLIWLDWIGLDWIGLGWIGLDLIGFDWIWLDLIGFDWIELWTVANGDYPDSVSRAKAN